MIEHCISLFHKNQIEKIYRIYITDCLQAIAENTTHLMSLRQGVIDYGSKMQSRWMDLAYSDVEKLKKIDEFNAKTTDEVVDGIWNNIKKGGGRK